MKQVIEKIIRAAILAPSGENAQPWRFRLTDKGFQIFNNPVSDQSLYNWGQRASLLAIGAAIANIRLAAGSLGYETLIDFFPDEKQHNLVADVEFESRNTMINEPLEKYIGARCTNRKSYNSQRILTADELRELNLHLSVRWLTKKEDIKTVAGTVSVSEKILFENKRLHNFFFEHINWTKAEDEQKKIGFYIETLELPPPAKAGFKLFRHWGVLRLLNKLGVSKMVAKENSKIYSTASAIGAITVGDLSPRAFVGAGEVLEQVWLTATKFGLSLQPMTGVLWFRHRIKNGAGQHFSPTHQKDILSASQRIKEIFAISDKEELAMLFRVGEGGTPSARSLRFSIDEVLM